MTPRHAHLLVHRDHKAWQALARDVLSKDVEEEAGLAAVHPLSQRWFESFSKVGFWARLTQRLLQRRTGVLEPSFGSHG